MAEAVECVSCRIVYADPMGACHLQLPVFVDPQGALHASLSPASDVCDAEQGLAHICRQGLGPEGDETRREHLQRVLERALSEDTSAPESPRRAWLQHSLQRLGSFSHGSAEEKDALRRALLSQRAASLSAARAEAEALRPPRTCFLTYTEQRLLLQSH